MRSVSIRLCCGILLLNGLVACQTVKVVEESATLIDLNNNFVTLSQQAEEAKNRFRENEIDRTTFDSTIETNRVAFAENAEKAVEVAEKATSAQTKVSLLNVAVRSYLKSGPVGDKKIPDLAQQGITQCSSAELRDLNALPVTCGYFHIVSTQAVGNETLRTLTRLSTKAVEIRESDGNGFLSATEGKELKTAFDQFLELIPEVENARRKADLAAADEKFRAVFDRQEIIFYCNALDARLRFDDVVATGPDWSRETTKADADSRLKAIGTRLGVEETVCDR